MKQGKEKRKRFKAVTPIHNMQKNEFTTILVLAIGFAIVLFIFLIFLRQPNAFTELYFEEIPTQQLELNQNYTFSFTIISHERATTDCNYSINCMIYNETGTIHLSPNENKTLTFTLNPRAKIWLLNSFDRKTENLSIPLGKNALISNYPINTTEKEIAIETPTTNLLINPILLFNNLTIDELTQKRYFTSEVTEYGLSDSRSTNETFALLVRDKTLFIEGYTEMRYFVKKDLNCTIKLEKMTIPHEVQEIYFFYDIYG